MSQLTRTAGLGFALLASGCVKDAPVAEVKPATPPAAKVEAKPEPKKPEFNVLSRTDFNRKAQELFLPLFWSADRNNNKSLDADELAVLWGPQNAVRELYVNGKEFTPKFGEIYQRMQKAPDFTGLSPEEKARREAVLLELSQGRPTLIETDLSAASAEDKAIAEHVFNAAVILERIYAKQLGTFELLAKIPADDVASQSLFHRNQGPWCAAPKTEKDPNCSALAEKPKHISGLYPADIQADPKFCATLEKEKNGKALMDHFSTVERDGKGFKAVPYNVAFAAESESIAKELDAAAAAITSADEAGFKAYLTATAAGFRTNNWEPSNETWAALGVNNSKWYLRIAPDEVYYEPCAWKAGYAVNFSRINKDSIAWQKKLEPVKAEMEGALATLAGAPYKARDVKFKLPDFIDVILNSGDQRNPHGATIGQSLPNWGAVAAKGGRTVAMTNLYTDSDSQEALKNQMSSIFCAESMKRATTDAKAAVMSTVLHEAAHNLGPSHEYKVKGKEDDEIFGGPLASTMEELKAQTASLYFSEWLVTKNLLTKEEAEQAHLRDVAWAIGHISRGMYSADGKPKNYSQLASIQMGTLFKAGALSWKAEEKATNGTDVGCLEVDFAKWVPTVNTLAGRVLKAKGSGDKKGAEAMVKELVDAKDDWSKMKDTLSERWLRAPKATFVYSVKK